MTYPPLPFSLLGLSLLVYVAGTLLGAAGGWSSRRLAHASLGAGLVGSFLGLAVAVYLLLDGVTLQTTLSVPGFTSASPFLVMGLCVDPLSALFLLLISLVGFAVTLASVGYLDRYVHERRAHLAGLYNLFLLTMVVVVTAGTTFLFLVGWEAMTLVSYFLVIHEHESWEVRRAGITYLVMSHAAAAAVLTAMVLLAVGTGTTSFAQMGALATRLSPLWTGSIFVAAVLGFGTKAGLVPFHIWLPEAHPAAPSNVSALMSGIMIKVGIYGILRVVFQALGGGPPLWWGFTLLALGGISTLVGVLNAIAQHDIKRLLAFHSVENIGIIVMALGASLVFLSLGWPTLAALALLAGLLHTLNHALFKALLFLGAGGVAGATGTRDMEQMGGLARKMPATAATFLVGAMAISALPPLNGFVSEWLLFQAFFGSFATGSLGTEMAFTAAAGVLALASGLAAYCFVKAFGITFLARPRSPQAAAVSQDVPVAMQGGMALIAGACIALGVLPVFFLGLFSGSVRQLTGVTLSVGSPFQWASALPRPAAGTGGSLAIGVVALLLAVILLVALVLRRWGSPTPAPRDLPWDCGLDAPTSRMEYTASGYAQPVLRVFSSYYLTSERVETSDRKGSRPGVLAKTSSYESEVSYPLVEHFYDPLTRGIYALSRRVARLQSGGIHAYLAYIVLTLVVLLILMRFFGGVGP